MSYKISKSKCKLLKLLLDNKNTDSEYVYISDQEYTRLKNVAPQLYCPYENDDYKLLFEERCVLNHMDYNIWNIVQETSDAYWNQNMGGTPVVMNNQNDGTFVRFYATKENDEYLTTGVKSKIAYGDGKFECEARFKTGKSSWPAIWICHPNGSLNNYEKYFEVDISEYYETRDVTDTVYHTPSSMRGGGYFIPVAKTPIIKDGWNKFECSWNENNIFVYINNENVMAIHNDGDSTHFPIDSDARTFSILLSMQYEGHPGLNRPDDSELPLWMDVRNIKIWEKK